jgi:hypothetical protein
MDRRPPLPRPRRPRPLPRHPHTRKHRHRNRGDPGQRPPGAQRLAQNKRITPNREYHVPGLDQAWWKMTSPLAVKPSRQEADPSRVSRVASMAVWPGLPSWAPARSRLPIICASTRLRSPSSTVPFRQNTPAPTVSTGAKRAAPPRLERCTPEGSRNPAIWARRKDTSPSAEKPSRQKSAAAFSAASGHQTLGTDDDA